MKTRISSIQGFILGVHLLVLCSCSGIKSSTANGSSTVLNFTAPICSTPTSGVTPPTGINVMPITVSNCTTSYQNEPLVTVKICAHGSTTNCQTLNNILLDTGSFGLRVFSGMLNSSLLSGLTTLTSGAGTLAECAQFGDGSSLWGTVAEGDVVLGDLSGVETASNVPFQLINSTYGHVPSNCSNSYSDPYHAHFSGILGVGLWSNDCPSCVASSSGNHYFSCTSSACTSTSVPAANQVTNPVASLATDNQGVQLVFGAVSSSTGAPASTGYMILGIDSRTTSGGYYSNASTGYTYYGVNSSLDFQVDYNGSYYPSFLDSGSNLLYFPNNSGIAVCSASSGLSGYLCPSPSTTISPVFRGCASAEASPGCTGTSITPTLTIYNAVSLWNTGNIVFSSMAYPVTSSTFDVGFPFFLGKTVIVGINGVSSSLGTGPYWAF